MEINSSLESTLPQKLLNKLHSFLLLHRHNLQLTYLIAANMLISEIFY